jgi:hypothetical protein
MFAVYSRQEHDQVAALIRSGVADPEIAKRTGVTRSTVNRWRHKGLPTRCALVQPDAIWRPPASSEYAYLLGLYLGDGCLSTGWSQPQLRISLDATYDGIVDEAERAIKAVVPGLNVHRYSRAGVVEVQAWGPVWLLAFPQHGPGKKHERRIELVDWQRQITHACPRELLRGLIHSDGCRTVNRFAVDLPLGGRRVYAYARYFFSNLSADIRGIFTEHCDLLGIRWTLSNPRNVSVSDRRSVALLDQFIGPKT